MKSLIPLLLFFACGSDTPAPTGEIKYQISSYDYEFDIRQLSPAEARATLQIEVQAGGNCLTIPMRALVELTNATLDGAPAELTQSDNTLTACGSGWNDGATVALELTAYVSEETWGNSQVGYGVYEDLDDQPFHYMVSWVGGCDRFGPCDNRAAAFASYTFLIHHEAGFQATCPGTITHPNETSTRCVFENSAPTYSAFGWAASPNWSVSTLATWRGVDIVLYDLPGADYATDFDVDNHTGFLSFMADQFGPYPYGDELRFVVGPTYWQGFEHPGNIVLDERLNVGLNPALPHTVNHEIAHLWAGNQVTLEGTYDFVWKEAMVEYLVFVYEHEVLSESLGMSTARRWYQSAPASDFHLVPDEKPPLLDYYGDVYNPGPMILFRQLEVMYGRTTILGAIASILGTNRTLSVSQLKETLESATGANLTAYFDRWVYGSGTPTFPTYNVAFQNAPMAEVTVTQATAGATFPCGFTVQVSDGTSTSDVSFLFEADGPSSQTKSITPGFTISETDFNPYAECLAYEATSNLLNQPRINPWLSAQPPKKMTSR